VCALELATVDGEPPDLVQGADSDSKADLLPLPAPSETYQLLDAATCQCNAATNASVANMVELERHWARIVMECDSKGVRKNLCLDRDLLALHATGIRNTAAASALEAFYQLAGLEAQKHYLQRGIEETERTLKRLDEFRQKGLAIPKGVDRSSVALRLRTLQDQKLQLDFLRIQLNGQLQKLMGCSLDEFAFYWPQADWQPDLTPVDVQSELTHGLANRTDLRGLSLVICRLEKQTLPVGRAVLKFADGTVGSVEPIDGWIHVARCFRCNKSELPVRRRQLAIFYHDTELAATAEIKSAAYKITLQQQRVRVAQQKVQELRDRLQELTEARNVQDIAIFEISKVRVQTYEAESDLVRQVVGLQVARVGLRKAQGTLAQECGFSPVLCCEGKCDGARTPCSDKTCSK